MYVRLEANFLDRLYRFLDAWADDWMLADHLGEKLTCNEAETLADLLEAAGRPEAAKRWLFAHSLSDDPGDEHYVEEDS